MAMVLSELLVAVPVDCMYVVKGRKTNPPPHDTNALNPFTHSIYKGGLVAMGIE